MTILIILQFTRPDKKAFGKKILSAFAALLKFSIKKANSKFFSPVAPITAGEYFYSNYTILITPLGRDILITTAEGN